MKNWQYSRNYRKIRQADGSVKHIITVDGVNVEVSSEVFTAYSQMDRRERLLEEWCQKIPHVSLEKLTEADVPIDIYTNRHIPSAEDIVIEAESDMEHAALLLRLPEAIEQLTDTEQTLITAIYLKGISVREYARINGVTLRAIQKRRDAVLKKLKNFFSEDIPQG